MEITSKVRLLGKINWRNKIIFFLSAIILLTFSSSTSHAADVRYSYDPLNRLVKVDYSNGIIVEYIYDAAGNRLAKETTQSPESDGDGYFDNWDNCPQSPNGSGLGTCVRTMTGVVIGSGVSCTNNGNCEAGETCQLGQGDINNNGIGDACECYANLNGDGSVNVFDLIILKNEYNRNDCSVNPCNADCNDDGNVNGFDLIIMKNQYNRIGCPVIQ